MNDRKTSLPLPPERTPSINDLARAIVLDGFKSERKWPGDLVTTSLPIPIAKGTRKRIAKKFGLAMDPSFHSAYDKAIHLIRTEYKSVS